jgi:hypothetical protein
MVNGGDRPHDRCAAGLRRHGFGGPFDVANPFGTSRQEPRDAQHDRGRIDSGDACTESSGVARRDSGSGADVDHDIGGVEPAQPGGKVGIARAADGHAERGNEPTRPGKSAVVGVMVG